MNAVSIAVAAIVFSGLMGAVQPATNSALAAALNSSLTTAFISFSVGAVILLLVSQLQLWTLHLSAKFRRGGGMSSLQKLGMAVGLAVLSTYPALQAAGQAAPATSDRADASSALLEEVIVQARRRAGGEAAQDTPVSVSAFSGAQFEAVFAQTPSANRPTRSWIRA